jgi:NAD(P)-dependent dehydrogenase (short-subunit alcohol dehydrogenase family)
MQLGLDGVVALVVGGAGTIGTAVSAALAAEGAVVVLAGRTAATLERAAADLGPSAGFVVLDTRDATSVGEGIADVISRFGPIGVVVNTAAPSARTLDASKNSDPDQVLDAFDAKALGYLRVANAVIPGMRAAGFGRIVNVSGQNAYLTATLTGAVRNSAVIVLSKGLADSLAGTGVTVNVVNPGIVTETPSPTVEVGRGGDSTPAQVAALVTFLASAPAAAISGESIAVGHRVLGSAWL